MVVYLGIGTNLGNRQQNIRKAVQKISALQQTKVIKLSRIIQTDPAAGPPAQAKFLNAALKIQTSLSPLRLLSQLQIIEKDLGRLRRHRRNYPRSIDIDILFYGTKFIRRRELKIPHPKIFSREFVMQPLLDVL